MNNAARVPMTAGERVCEAQRQKDEAQRRLRAQGFEDCGGIACLDEIPAAAGGKRRAGQQTQRSQAKADSAGHFSPSFAMRTRSRSPSETGASQTMV